MIAFEIRVNGRLVSTIGAGEGGSLTAAVSWHGGWWRWFQGEQYAVLLEGRDSGGAPTRWAAPPVRAGDELTIRIVESESLEPPPIASPPT